MNTKPKCVNRGTITHIWTDLNTKIDLPKELQLQYTNNKEFVAFVNIFEGKNSLKKLIHIFGSHFFIHGIVSPICINAKVVTYILPH